jgi:Putative peptidoglycan binding domain
MTEPMKPFLASLACLLLLGFSSAGLLAKDARGNASPPEPAPVHRSASTPAVTAPISGAHLSGGPSHFSGTGSYRPLTISANGQRTLVYPSVRNSTIHPRGGSNLSSTGSSSKTGSGLRSSSATGFVTKAKLDPQASARLRNWGGNVSTAAQAHQNHASNCHHHHDKNWWKHHCVTLIFFDWGWWGWYDGWWYPAWGYDPYSYYQYNEPIYDYNGFTPDQVVAGVQSKLQQLGYYTYAIDGKMGPLTQGAIARYQRDHHMSITSGIDPATLGALGLAH